MKRVLYKRDGTRVELPLLEQAVSAAKAVVREVVRTDPPITQEQVDARMAICLGCEDISADNKSCTKCGCNLANKCSFKSSSCPVGKWGVL